MFVYMITNQANGKHYVGKTVSASLESYFNSKWNEANKGGNSCPRLYNAMRKYPDRSNWAIHPLMSNLKTNEQLCREEIALIALLNSRDPDVGYNISAGGDGVTGQDLRGEKNPFYGKQHTREFKEWQSATRTGVPSPKTQGANHWTHEVGAINPFQGKHHTDELKTQWSEQRKGQRTSPCTEFKPGERRSPKTEFGSAWLESRLAKEPDFLKKRGDAIRAGKAAKRAKNAIR